MYLVGGFVKWEDLNKNTHWGVILLFGSTISLGANIKATGAAEWLAGSVVSFVGPILNALPFSWGSNGIPS